MSSYYNSEVERQADFRTHSCTISDAGRSWTKNEHLLAPCYERENLYSGIRGENGAYKFFNDRGIRPDRWESMVSSQAACVNFLLPLVSIDGALLSVVRAIDSDVQDIVDICHNAMPSRVTFEWTGGTAGELEKGGRHPTHVDGFMVAETDKGRRAYLIEWKYTEDGGGDYKGNRHPNQLKGYRNLYYACSSSFKSCVVMDELLYDPFDQIVRNRLLADRMVANGELGVSEAKVVVVVPEENTAYRERITSPRLAKRFPDLKTVDEVMQATLKDPDAAFKMVTPTQLREAVVDECGDAVSDWAGYIRERYGW